MLPVESILAVFPSTARVGALTLRPLTLYHATAMEVMGVDLGNPTGIDDDHVFIAAWLLTLDPREVCDVMRDADNRQIALKRWLNDVQEPLSDVSEAVNKLVDTCLSLNVPGESDGKKYFGPHGFGWTLELGEAVAHEYSITFDAAMSMPLATVFGMIACCRQRSGGKNGGPDYYERILIRNIGELRKKVYNG